MPKGGNKMDTKSDEQFLVIEATIESNNKESDKNQMKTDDKLALLTENLQFLTAFMMDQTNISKSSPDQKDTSTPLDPTTLVPTNRRDPSLEGGHSIKIGGIWTLKHEIRSPKFDEILIKTELKGDNDLDISNFFKHINMFLNVLPRLIEDLLPDY